MSFTINVDKRTSPGKPASKDWPLTLTLESASSSTLFDLKTKVQAANKRLSVARQRFTTLDKKPLLDDQQTLEQLGLNNGDTVYVKDLGPQVSWTTVFLTEYFGPLAIHPLFYYFAPTIWRTSFEHSRVQTLALYLVLIHFAKRELETLFVHRFSNATMPLLNLFKNSTHYWLLSGFLLAFAVYSPYYSAEKVAGTFQDNDTFLFICSVLFLLSEVANGYCHLILKWLRPAGSRVRKIPRGFAFELVSCPNYFFEFFAWAIFTALTFNPASLLFTVVSTFQMFVWAIKKHKAYSKEFGTSYPKRKVMFPFLY